MLKSSYFSGRAELRNASQNRSVLARGSRGEAVRRLQVALSTAGYQMPKSEHSRDGFDGIYGREMDDTVRELQKLRRLSVDGIAGRQVLSSMDRELVGLEQGLQGLGQATGAILGNFDRRLLAGLSFTPDDLVKGFGLQRISKLRASVRSLQPILANIGRDGNGSPKKPMLRSAVYRPSSGANPHGAVQFAAAPLAIPAAALALVAALEATALVLAALIAIVGICWSISVVVPLVMDKIKILWAAAMAELSAAIADLAIIVNESLEAFGKCGDFLLKLLKKLKDIAARGMKAQATKWIPINGKQMKGIPDPNVLKGMRNSLLDAAKILEDLVYCLSRNGLMGDESFRKLNKWMKDFRELTAKLGDFKEPIGKLW